MSKNSLHLAMFADYCRQHPEERFWQALRNWSGYDHIFAGNLNPRYNGSVVSSREFSTEELIQLTESLGLKDMFYVEEEKSS